MCACLAQFLKPCNQIGYCLISFSTKVYAPQKNRVSQRMLNYGLFQDSKFLVIRSTILLCFPWKFKLMCNNSRNLQQCSRVPCVTVWEPQLQALFWLRNYDSKDLKTWSLKLLASLLLRFKSHYRVKKKKKKKQACVCIHTTKQLGQTIQFTPKFLNPFWRHLQRIIILLLTSSKFVQEKQSGIW